MVNFFWQEIVMPRCSQNNTRPGEDVFQTDESENDDSWLICRDEVEQRTCPCHKLAAGFDLMCHRAFEPACDSD